VKIKTDPAVLKVRKGNLRHGEKWGADGNKDSESGRH